MYVLYKVKPYLTRLKINSHFWTSHDINRESVVIMQSLSQPGNPAVFLNWLYDGVTFHYNYMLNMSLEPVDY